VLRFRCFTGYSATPSHQALPRADDHRLPHHEVRCAPQQNSLSIGSYGSISTLLAEATRPFMSAVPPIATNEVSRSETSRGAISRHQQAASPGRLPAPSRSADSTVNPSSWLWRPQGDDCSLATLSRMAGASAEEEINEPTGKFLRRRGDIMRLKLLASAVVS
jgi:hypothetical protein